MRWPPAGKPTADATALCIPTAQWGHPMCGPVSARGFVSGLPPWGGMTGMEWKSLGLLELSALPTIGAERWVPAATARSCHSRQLADRPFLVDLTQP